MPRFYWRDCTKIAGQRHRCHDRGFHGAYIALDLGRGILLRASLWLQNSFQLASGVRNSASADCGLRNPDCPPRAERSSEPAAEGKSAVAVIVRERGRAILCPGSGMERLCSGDERKRASPIRQESDLNLRHSRSQPEKSYLSLSLSGGKDRRGKGMKTGSFDP